MKKKFIILISIFLIFGLAIVAYSVTKSSTNLTNSDSCCAMKDCCKDGVCKMGGECCKDKDSCPMKAKENASGEMKDCPMHNKDSKEMSAMNHESCCKDGKCTMSADGKCACECCKDGKCEMHKKDSEANATKGDCCKGKDSCPMKKGENKDKPKDN